jgi:Ser/Thr protein kinase RdoA (MazF antagonist)
MSDIQAEIDVLQHLDSAGISVARPIESAGGEYIGGVRAPEGERALVLFEYVTGHKPRSGDPAEMRAFGRTLARIHDAGERFQPDHQRFSYDLSLILDEPCRHLEQTLSPRPARWSAFLSIVTWLRTSLRELPLATLRWGMCHGDFQPKNTRVSDDGRITVFDFDHCGAGWHAYDLGIVRLTLPEISWGWFIDGYSEARGLNQTDRDAIPLFAMANRIQSMGFYAAHRDTTLWGSDAMSDTYFDDCLSHLQREQADSICRNASVDVTHRQSPSSSDTRP